FTGLTVFDSHPFDNGPIACEAIFYRAPRPRRYDEKHPAQDVESDSTTDESFPSNRSVEAISEQGQMFANRLRKNAKHLTKWARKQAIECYRVYDADLPDYALAIDIYGDKVHVQEYAPPSHIDPMKAVE